MLLWLRSRVSAYSTANLNRAGFLRSSVHNKQPAKAMEGLFCNWNSTLEHLDSTPWITQLSFSPILARYKCYNVINIHNKGRPLNKNLTFRKKKCHNTSSKMLIIITQLQAIVMHCILLTRWVLDVCNCLTKYCLQSSLDSQRIAESQRTNHNGTHFLRCKPALTRILLFVVKLFKFPPFGGHITRRFLLLFSQKSSDVFRHF